MISTYFIYAPKPNAVLNTLDITFTFIVYLHNIQNPFFVEFLDIHLFRCIRISCIFFPELSLEYLYCRFVTLKKFAEKQN